MRHIARALIIFVLLGSACAASESSGIDSASPDPEPNSWRVIADSPLEAGYGYSGVWSGKEMLIWGGSCTDRETQRYVTQRGGAAYNPLKDRWRLIPKAPIAGGSGYSVSWTDDEMIVWGDPDRGRKTKGNRGAAFDPKTNSWRRIAPAPLSGRSDHLAVWTGEELVVWGGYVTASRRERYHDDGAAYDPNTDTWRALPQAPLPAGYDTMGAWTGREVLVMTTPMGNDAQDYPRFDKVAAYDPGSDSWRSLARPPQVSYVSPPVAYVDGKLAVLSLGGTVDGGEDGYDKEYETGGVYDYSSDEWSPHSDPPRRPNQTWEQTAMGDEIVIDALAYRPSTDTWRKLPEFPLREREFPVLVWTGRELIVWGGAKEPRGRNGQIEIVDPPPPLNDGAAYTPPH